MDSFDRFCAAQIGRELTSSRGVDGLDIEHLCMTHESGLVPVSVALRDLRAEGHEVTPDKLQRLRAFGIATAQLRNRWYFTPEALRDLRYVLEVEQAFGLARNHDGLALELAYLGYHTVPWDRVHASAQKRVATFQAYLDRTMHRANNWYAPGFHERRIPNLARQLARHAIPESAVEQAQRMAVLRSALERLLRALLEAAYLDKPFRERDIAGFFLDLEIGRAHV